MERRILTVRKSLRYNGATHRMELSTPKSGKARTVLFGEKLHNILQNAGRTGFPLQNYCTLLTEDGRQHYVVTTHPAGTEQMQPVNFVCRQKDGSMVSPDLVEKTCRRAAQAAGIPSFHFHLLRHTYTTNLLRGGASPRDVQELLGHAELSTTMNVYAHSNEEEKRRAACLLDQLAACRGMRKKIIRIYRKQYKSIPHTVQYTEFDTNRPAKREKTREKRRKMRPIPQGGVRYQADCMKTVDCIVNLTKEFRRDISKRDI